MTSSRPNVRLLSAGPLVSMFDRFGMAPLIIPIASAFHVSVAAVALTATAYYLVYGAVQPLWGFLSDRTGRIRVTRISLAGLCAGSIVSAAAPGLPPLFAGRIVAAVACSAIIPTALVYIGDTVPFARRHGVIADLLAAVAVGTALGTLGAGVIAHTISWRVAFLVPAALSAVLVVALGRLPEPDRRTAAASPREQFKRAVARPWARFLIALAVPEGAMMLGFVVYLAPALESTGSNPAVAGLVVATYGLAVLTGTQLVKRHAGRLPGWMPVVIGGAMIMAGFLAAAADQHVVGVLVASVMIGGCYSVMHSGIQSWATDIAPDARGTAAALFTFAVFSGAAISSGAVSPLAEAHDYRLLFLSGFALSVPVVLVAAIARARYPGTPHPDDEAVPGVAAG